MNISFAIVGRPNVGKSTLFNRMVASRRDHAIVHPKPGVTRDRRIAPGEFYGLDFLLIDTAGFEEKIIDSIEDRMFAQTSKAIEDADILIFMLDVRSGVTPYDHQYAQLIRETEKPVILVANKAEAVDYFYEADGLGFGSAIIHQLNMPLVCMI